MHTPMDTAVGSFVATTEPATYVIDVSTLCQIGRGLAAAKPTCRLSD